MKAAIVILGNIWICPYVNTYKSILAKVGCGYDVILWDRDGSDSGAPCGYSHGKVTLKNPFVKLFYYFRYARFIKRTVVANGYDKLIVSGPHLAVLLSSFLVKRYKRRFILDYRDVAIEQYPPLSWLYSRALSASACNVISSSGFRRYLPSRFKYLVSHNFNVEAAERSLECAPVPMNCKEPFIVLTVGSIRNFSSNVKVLASLGNNSRFSMRFAGRGDALQQLTDYAGRHNITNVSFSGFYHKEEESAIVAGATFMNIFFPDDAKHSAIMSNRFYLALLHKKPVIVTAGSTQAAIVEKFGLGVVVNDCSNLDAELAGFIENLDYKTFCNNCNRLLAQFIGEHRELECAVSSFLQE